MPDPHGSTNGSGQFPAVTDPGATEPEPKRRKWLPWLLGLLVLLLIAGAAAAAYFVSRPKQRVVPTVTGLNINVAKTILSNQDFATSEVHVPSGKPQGIVINESPAGGTKTDKGSTITLTVSGGQGSVIVPNVQGESQSAATTTLKKGHLKVTRVVPTSSRGISQGQAIKTSPAAAASVPRGTGVTLFMSTGPPSQKVPGVRRGHRPGGEYDAHHRRVHRQHGVTDDQLGPSREPWSARIPAAAPRRRPARP